jgi:hypothetical protein
MQSTFRKVKGTAFHITGSDAYVRSINAELCPSAGALLTKPA